MLYLGCALVESVNTSNPSPSPRDDRQPPDDTRPRLTAWYHQYLRQPVYPLGGFQTASLLYPSKGNLFRSEMLLDTLFVTRETFPSRSSRVIRASDLSALLAVRSRHTSFLIQNATARLAPSRASPLSNDCPISDREPQVAPARGKYSATYPPFP